MKIKSVCLFGIYDPKYSRSKTFISGFKDNGVFVTECNVDPRKNLGLKKYFLLYKEYLKIRKNKFDIIVVCYPGQGLVLPARLLFWGKPIILDAFLSFYDSNVLDRNMYGRYSFGAIKSYLLDLFGCIFADFILLDTNAHIRYFTDTFHIKTEKFIRLPIGADEKVFFPRKRFSW